MKNLKLVNHTAISKSPLSADIVAKQSVNWGKAKTFPIREIYNFAKDILKYSKEKLHDTESQKTKQKIFSTARK